AGFASTWIGLLIMLTWAALPQYKRLFHPFDFLKRQWPVTRELLRLSIPSGVATLAVMTGFGLFSFIVGKLDEMTGAQTVNLGCPGAQAEPVNGAATMVVVAVLKLTFTACLAFGTSTATLVSQSLGEGDGEKASRFGWASVRLGLL